MPEAQSQIPVNPCPRCREEVLFRLELRHLFTWKVSAIIAWILVIWLNICLIRIGAENSRMGDYLDQFRHTGEVPDLGITFGEPKRIANRSSR